MEPTARGWVTVSCHMSDSDSTGSIISSASSTISAFSDIDIPPSETATLSNTPRSPHTPSNTPNTSPSPPIIPVTLPHINTPVNIPTVMATVALTVVVNLPIPGTKGAPKKFKGKYSAIRQFINHYEKICAQKAVTDAHEKIENITQYCSRRVREFMEGLPSFSGTNWNLFTQDLLEYFDAERDVKRYTCSNLDSFCKKARKQKRSMRMTLWKQYNRDFIRIAGWLISHRKLTADEQALYFWKGIPKDFREKLEARLLIIQPNHNLEQPFKIENINRVAKSLLLRNRFDHSQIPDEDDSSDSDSSDSASEDSDDEDSDDEAPLLPTPKKSRDRESTKKPTVAEVPIKPKATARTTSTKKENEEMEDLINQMNKMSVTDSSYSILYFRAYQISPIITELVPRPLERRAIANRLNLNAAPAPYNPSNSQGSQESGNNPGFN